MHNKPDFDKAQNEATRLLLQQDLDSLFIDVRNFKFKDRILIDSIQNYAKLTNRLESDFICDSVCGCCVIYSPRCKLILYDNREKNKSRKHWGIAHELGHVILGHTSDGPVEEIEANFFVAQLLMPEIAMLNLAGRFQILYPEHIHTICNVSYTSACKRIKTLNKKWGYNRSVDDKLLLSKLRPILNRICPPEKDKQYWDQWCFISSQDAINYGTCLHNTI